jgi:hypothetical protein
MQPDLSHSPHPWLWSERGYCRVQSVVAVGQEANVLTFRSYYAEKAAGLTTTHGQAMQVAREATGRSTWRERCTVHRQMACAHCAQLRSRGLRGRNPSNQALQSHHRLWRFRNTTSACPSTMPARCRMTLALLLSHETAACTLVTASSNGVG